MKKMRILALIMTCAILLSSIMIPVSADEPNNNTPAITINGVADEAIWANPVATYTLGLQVDTPSGATTTREDTTPAIAKFAYDSEYLYFYYETTNPARSGYQALTVQLRPKGVGMAANTGSANGEALFFKVGLKSTSFSNCNDVQTNGNVSTYVWKGTNPTTNKSLIDKFGFNKNATADNTNATNNYTIGDGYYDKTEIAVSVATDEETGVATKTIEMKFPLADSYKTALQTTLSGVDLQVGFWEITGYSGSDTTEAATNASNGGYVVDRNSYGWNGEASKGSVFNLPSLTKTAPVLVGFQSRTNLTDNNKYDVRFVSVVDYYTGFTRENSKLGYLFNNGERDSVQTCTKVYTELKAGNGTIKASDFGGKYFFCFTITGLSTADAQTYQLSVSCFTQKDTESDVEYCANPVDVKITYDKENSKAVFTY